jgi:TIR domain
MPPHIFVSYRREDAAGDAGRLVDHLHRRFGRNQVFLDIDTIDPGTDFVQMLHASLQETAAVLVVIGPRWTSARAANGTRRLDDAKDFVRLEVEASLGRNIPVVPVLVQGATMPRAEDLPASLSSLATRQAATLDHAEFHDDAERLCDRLATMIRVDTSTPWSRLRRWWPAAAVVGVLALGVIGYVALGTSDRKTAAAANATSANAPSDAVRVAEKTAPVKTGGLDQTPRAEALIATASAQRQRNQLAENWLQRPQQFDKRKRTWRWIGSATSGSRAVRARSPRRLRRLLP